MSVIEDLYKQVILDHNRSPRNRGPLAEATHTIEANNSLCGDCFTVQAQVDDQQVVRIQFEGTGCAISQASMSLMTEAAIGRPFSEVQEICSSVLALIDGEPLSEVHRERIGEASVLEEVQQYPMRHSCATLAWKALQQVTEANHTHSRVSTE